MAKTHGSQVLYVNFSARSHIFSEFFFCLMRLISQCGFCTPGFIMSAYALLRSKETPPSLEEMEDALVGEFVGRVAVN